MTFRARLTAVSAAAVAVAVVLACALAWLVARQQLRSEIDASLRERAAAVLYDPRGGPLEFRLRAPVLGGAGGYAQLVDADGRSFRSREQTIALPIAGARRVAAGERDPYLEDATVHDTHVRILTTTIAPGVALQIARPLDEVDRTLGRLALLLALVGAGGIGLAAAAGLVVTRAALAPVRRLTEASEHVAATQDLSARIAAVGGDELGRLAASFNRMLGALEDSVGVQRRLVADASHELRTPLTSLRTNVEVLEHAGGGLSPDERERILADVRAELEELTALVGDLVELARGEDVRGAPVPLRLDELVLAAVERAERQAPTVQFAADVEPTTVEAVPERLDRAVSNLLDNAAKWSPPGGTVEIAVHGTEIVVRDHGPGIAEADLPHVFERFYRAPSARGVPGSGLGLAIARQVAEEHGGSVVAERAPGGGARLRLRIGTAPTPATTPGPAELVAQSHKLAAPHISDA